MYQYDLSPMKNIKNITLPRPNKQPKQAQNFFLGKAQRFEKLPQPQRLTKSRKHSRKGSKHKERK
jgi:hypothetical protein